MPAQPAAQDEIDEHLVPVGTTAGFLLLEMLSLQGWEVSVEAHPAGVLVTCRLGAQTLTRAGASVAAVASGLFEAAAVRPA